MRITEPTLTAAEEVDLTRCVEAGLYAAHLLALGPPAGHSPGQLGQVVTDGRLAWQRLWLANAGMVKLLANRYGRGDPDIVEDLIQEGWTALAEALMRFDWARGVRLSTHTWRWVKHHMVHVMQARSGWEARTAPELAEIRAEPAAEDDDDVDGILAPLSLLERQVLLARANGRRQCDLAQELGVSVSSIRRTEGRAVARARAAYLAMTA